MDIPLRINQKIYKRQYRLNPADSAEAKRQISEMLEAKIIEPSENVEFNSPIFLVAKRNGSERLVVDLSAVITELLPITELQSSSSEYER